MSFILKSMSHKELISEMESVAKNQTGVALKFRFELTSDGNLDLFRVDNHEFTLGEIVNMVNLNWFDHEIIEDAREQDLDPFEWHEDTLSQSHQLFQFVLEKTFGEGSKVVGTEELEDCVLLNIAIPVK